MSAYPTSPAWCYPVTHSLTFNTGIATGINSKEQRWMLTTGVESWELSYPHLSVSERDTLLAAYETAKGSYDQTLSLLFNGTNYTGLYFDADTLAFTELNPRVFSGTVKLTTVVRAADTGATPSAFPALSTGAPTQLPFSHTRTFDTSSVRTDGGRYSYARRASGLRVWTAGGTALNDTEAGAIWSMFKLACGRWRSFQFTDPDSLTVYAACRFGSDTCEWRMIAPNQNTIQVTIQQLA